MLDFSDLVNSFTANGGGIVDRESEIRISDDDMEGMKESLVKLFRFENGDDVRRNVVLEVEKAWWRVIGDNSSPSLLGSKRRLTARLRNQGLDAGVCKSKWENKGRLQSGDHEYIDVNVGGTRYIIIVSLLEEFEIARQTDNYSSLLKILPQISVCKIEKLKEIVRIMSKAVKKSMNQLKMVVPPWRRSEYLEAKWFGSYERTINEFPTKNATDLNINNTKTVGFKLMTRTCDGGNKEDFVRKEFGIKMGNLAMVMNGPT